MVNCELVSVIMPSYNSEKYIEDAIKSVLGQTYFNFELIIVDDCSTDRTVDIIRSFSDKRIKLLINDNNIGAALTRNRALKEAAGKYIAFLDSDDTWDITKLECQISFMEKHKYSFTYTDYRICLNGIWEKYIRTGPKKVNYKKIINYCYFSTITVVYDRDVVGLIQVPYLKKNNDYAMWLYALRKTDAYRVPHCLSYYIKHNGSLSTTNKSQLLVYHYRLFRTVLRKSRFVSIVLTINNLWHGFWKKLIYKKKVKY